MILKRSKKADKAENEVGIAEKAKNSWEFSTGKIILRIAAGLFFVSYLAFTGPLAWQWAWSAYYKSQPLSHLDTLIAEDLNSDDQSQFMAWVHLRPAYEREEIQKKLEPLSAKLDPFFFLLFSQWEAEKLEIEKTVFWHFYARYRVRFDALRCGAPDSVKNVDGIMSLMPEGHITATVQHWPHLIPVSIEEVLEFDARMPAENSPARICRIVYELEGRNFKAADRERWQQIRHTLRSRTELSLAEMWQELRQRAAAPAPTPEPTAPDSSETAPDKDAE